MRAVLVAFLAMAMVALSLGVATTASAASNVSASATRDLTPVVVGPVATSRFGGGDWVGVRAGDANFGVLYGTPADPNRVVIFAEYTRYLGGARVVNEQGQYLATRGIPVYTVLAQSLDRFIEFENVSASAGFDLSSANGTVFPMPVNVPVKALNLRTGTWNLTSLKYEVVGGVTYVNFTIRAQNLTYTWVNPFVSGARGTGNDMLDAVAFTFHLKVDVVQRSANLPWYTVTVTDTAPREVTNVSFDGFKNVSGPAVQMGAKYDHLIEGWDFRNATDKLALETHILFGNVVPDRTVDFVHAAYAEERADNGTATVLDNESAADAPATPHAYTRDRIYFDDNFTRIGEFRWVSNVTVDSQPETMLFQVQGGNRIALTNGESWFFGFQIHGAFIYPAGATIEHDPAMSVESFVPALPTGVNLTPLGILLIQVAVVGVAIVPALYLRSKARRQR